MRPPALVEDERLRVPGDEFQQLDVFRSLLQFQHFSILPRFLGVVSAEEVSRNTLARRRLGTRC